MKKRSLIVAALCSMCLALGNPLPVMADASKVVTLGADLTDEQKNTMMKYFKADANQVQIITVNNQDERNYLGKYISSEQIGTRTLSCAYVKPTQSGGIKVRTANLNYVTCNMLANALSTAGISNCEAVAACPYEVSGTGALTGVMMAYESASGKQLDSTKKDLATKEVVVTGDVAKQVGGDNATNIINQAKLQIIGDNVQNADDIYNIVVNISNNNNVTLTDDEINTIVNLLQQISQQDYDYSEMQETLERVNDNVTGKAEESSDSSDDEDSIVDNVDQSALGDNVIESSTEDPGLAEETGAADESGEESWEEFPASDDSGENTDGSTDESADGDISEVGGTDTGDGSDSSEEITDISQLNTDFLGDDAKAKFEKAKTFCQGEYSGDEDALYEVMGDDAAVTVTLDSDTANKLSIKVLQKYLGILGNGAVSYQEDGTEKYITPELNMLDKEMKKLFGIDVIDDGESSEDIDVLGDAVSSDDKDTLYKDTMKFFEKLYGESSESSDSADGSENVTTDESATDEVGDESYDETIDEESYEE